MKVSAAALIATYRRPRELHRLLQSLAQVERVTTVIVVDNDSSEEVRALVEYGYAGAHYVNPGANFGCGGGLKVAEEYALRLKGKHLSHLLILDDDTVLAPETVVRLAEAMERQEADLAYPLVTDERGRVGWLPGFTDRSHGLRREFDGTPEDFRARFGDGTRDFIWAQGICLLVARGALERFGTHRDDFWVRGEDLEFSLRLTAGRRGIFVPTAVVQHLPPPEDTGLSNEAEYLKHCALLQNIAFIGFRLAQGHRIAWTIAGALRRFFRSWSWTGLSDATRAVWRGAVLGKPAGAGPWEHFRARFKGLPPAR